ncbi:MAG: hypothetical protein LBK99_23905 [Opitutaceae bacterium]|jgi:hypothetical protein|nr:hypothetical protein [Opitutaceae bacterium]
MKPKASGDPVPAKRRLFARPVKHIALCNGAPCALIEANFARGGRVLVPSELPPTPHVFASRGAEDEACERTERLSRRLRGASVVLSRTWLVDHLPHLRSLFDKATYTTKAWPLRGGGA